MTAELVAVLVFSAFLVLVATFLALRARRELLRRRQVRRVREMVNEWLTVENAARCLCCQ